MAALAHWAQTRPAAFACIDDHSRWQWDAFHACVRDTAAALQQVVADSAADTCPAVGILMDNGADFAIAACSVAAIGATFTLFPADMAAEATRRLVHQSGVRVVITDEPNSASLPRHGVVGVTLQQLKARGPTGEAPSFEADPLAFSIVYSSGTTGNPKAIVHPRSARAAIDEAARRLGVDAGAVNLVALPMFNNLALVTWLPALVNGGCNVILKSFSPRAFAEAVEAHAVTHFVLSPRQYRELLASNELDRYRLDSLKLHISSSSRLGAAEKAAISSRLPGRFCEIYGVTEGGVGTLLQVSEGAKLNTVGKPMPSYEMAIVDEQGREAPVGQIGYIAGHSAFMMSGYQDPGHVARYWARAAAPERRFFVPGDLGFFDEDGYLTVLDRAVDTVQLGGQRWFPSVIEDELLASSGCAELAVSFAQAGQPPASLTVRWVGNDDDEQPLRQALALKYPNFVPALIRCRHLPRNAMGKLLRTELGARPAKATHD